MDFIEAARRVYLGRSVAFFGAGFSKGATGVNNLTMEASFGLAKQLSDALRENEVLPLELASQEYMNR